VTVIAKDNRFTCPKHLCYFITILGSIEENQQRLLKQSKKKVGNYLAPKHDASVIAVYRMVVVKAARILREWLEEAPCGRPGL
jgi:hypothetical protein